MEQEKGKEELSNAMVEEKVLRAMDLVSVIRVFDFEGLMDGVLEVGERLKGTYVRATKTGPPTTNPKADEVGLGEQLPGDDLRGDSTPLQDETHQPEPVTPPRRLEIPDSDEDDEDEDMLLDLSPLPPTLMHIHAQHPARPPPGNASPIQQAKDTRTAPETVRIHHPADQTGEHAAANRPNQGTNRQTPPSLLLLPSLPRLLSPLMAANHIRAHALLVHLLRKLNRMTQDFPLCCVLLNGVVSSAGGWGGSGQHEPGPSAFERNTHLRPALGKTYDCLLDVGCLVTRFEDEGGGGASGEGWEYVFEVLHDREGPRTGRWAVLRAEELGGTAG